MIEAGFYNMDCMDGMKEFPDKYFDLAIVDPPYGDGGGGSQAVKDLAEGSTDTEHRDRKAAPFQKLGGVPGRDTLRTDSEKGKLRRVGGTWAEKFGKKL